MRMQNFLFILFLILTYSCAEKKAASSSNKQRSVTQPVCNIKGKDIYNDLYSTPSPHKLTLLSKDFDQLYENNPKSAETLIKDWVSSRLKSNITELNRINDPSSKKNAGIFLIKSGPKEYIIKITAIKKDNSFELNSPKNKEYFYPDQDKSCPETNRLIRLNRTIYANPQCLLSQNQTSKNTKDTPLPILSPEEIELFPKISKLVDSAKSDKYCLQVLRKAHGKQLDSFNILNKIPNNDSENEESSYDPSKDSDILKLKEVYYSFGKSIGMMHYYFSPNKNVSSLNKFKSFSHGDLHPHNVFYSQHNNKHSFYLIDNESNNDNDSISYDLYQSVTGVFSYLKSDLTRVYLYQKGMPHIFQKPSEDEIIQISKALKTIINKKPPLKNKEKLIWIAVDRLLSFSSGYLSVFPSNFDNILINHLTSSCRELIDAISFGLHTDEMPIEDKKKVEELIKEMLQSRIPPLGQCFKQQFKI